MLLNQPPPSVQTQRGRILAVLTQARGEWVPGPEIFRLAAQYSARVHELRKLGFKIENKTAMIDGQRHSWFRLVPGTPRPEPWPTVQQPLFADRHCDE